MATDFRALCAELADELDHNRQCLMDDRSLTHPLADRARAALAEPADGPAVPEGRGPAAVAEQPRPAPPAEGEVAGFNDDTQETTDD